MPDRSSGTVAAAGPPVGTALEAVADRISYLRARVGAPAADELDCLTLCHEPGALAALLDSMATGREVDDPVVAASVFSLSYAYRVAGTTLAVGWLTGTWCDPSAANMAIGIARDRPARVVYRSATRLDPAEATERLFVEHLDPFREAMRRVVRIGDRLLLGNIAAGVVSVARAVCDVADDPSQAWADVARWFADAPHDLGRFGAPIGPEFRRSTCCLWWKTTDTGGYCSDCSLTTAVHEPKSGQRAGTGR